VVNNFETGAILLRWVRSIVDSIVFSIDYQKANPTEKVFCFLHAANGHQESGEMASTTVYTKNGQIWFHHLVPGDMPCPLSLDDLKDSEKVSCLDRCTSTPQEFKTG